ncbi:TIGR03086 family metal-binding protein [Dactylosporangium sp. NPDC048998]|uniref:TIGR03086 family metal-binding protein n=1 Tax=Dactylosporangium sp. NPDC048998 TaxID=3363976 RepID=UPI003710723C
MPSEPDTARDYRVLADGFLARVRATPADRWDAPSPCRGWSARDVVAHLINGHRGFLAMAGGPPPAPADGVGVGPMSGAPPVADGADLAAAFAACRDDMLAMLADPGRAALRLPGGPMGAVPVAQAVAVVGSIELLVHTWDLARATGGDETLDPAQVARTHRAAEPYAAGLLATGAFDPPVPAPDGADAQTRFLCFAGRKPF